MRMTDVIEREAAGHAPSVRHIEPGSRAMLSLRPNCECCDADLPPAAIAYICTFECTFCPACAVDRLGGTCPNCAGELVRRPVRPAAALARFPAQTERHLRQTPCPGQPAAS